MEWLGKTGLVTHHFPSRTSQGHVDTETDFLSLGLITARSDAVILRVDSASYTDYLELQIVSVYNRMLSFNDCFQFGFGIFEK